MVKFGSLEIADLKIGSIGAEKAYLGTVQVWPEQTPPVGIGYLRFSSEESQTIGLNFVGTPVSPYFEYSINEGSTWTEWDYSPITFGDGVDVLLRGMNPNGINNNAYNYAYFSFGSNSPVECEGNIMFLIDYTQELYEIPENMYCFGRLFKDCTVLVSAPELPATTLYEGCYYTMFSGCTSLASAPELPATTMAEHCYGEMFYRCTSLTTPPELPSTELALGCYSQMFGMCTGLTSAPELPATTLALGCYSYMFTDCRSLTTPPELPATTLAVECYDAMFYNCRSLTSTPELPATTLADSCYENMFGACPLVDHIKIMATDISAEDCLKYWLAGVADEGVFECPEEMEDVYTRDISGIPTGWTINPSQEIKALRFSTTGTSQTISMVNKDGNAPSLEYSLDEGETWTSWDYSSITFGNGVDVLVRGMNTAGFSTSYSKYSKFAFGNNNVLVECSGSIMWLLDYTQDLTAIPNDYCFQYLFSECSALASAPELPATEMADYCYDSMFCKCTSLTTAPELPATTLAMMCYRYMFQECYSLTTAPELPATELAMMCYDSMFLYCTSLTTAPELPATILVGNCYFQLFAGCSSLNYVKHHITSWNTGNASNWLYGVAATGVVECPTASTIPSNDNSGIPSGWTRVNF